MQTTPIRFTAWGVNELDGGNVSFRASRMLRNGEMLLETARERFSR